MGTGINLQDGLVMLEDARALIGVLLYLDAPALCALNTVDMHRRSNELADTAWCQLCEICWREKSPRYQLTTERTCQLVSSAPSDTWREHYRDALIDGRRQCLKPGELDSLKWAFNFTPQAGGQGKASMQFVEFRASEPGSSRGHLILNGYPPLPYRLNEDGSCLDVANFPPHYVKRLDSWEWEITNDNVTFVSCVDENVDYNKRGFLKLTVEDILEQTDGLLSREDAEELLAEEGMVSLPMHVGLLRLLRSLPHRPRDDNAESELEEDISAALS